MVLTSLTMFDKNMTNESAGLIKTKEESEAAVSEMIRNELRQFGIESVPEEIVSRLALIEENSEFNNDSRMIREGFKNVWQELEKEGFAAAANQEEGELAAFVHDIGKSGSAEADRAGQLAVIRLFALENLSDPNIKVGEVVRKYFSPESGSVLEDLAKSGVNTEMTMREFYDQHGQWTYDILEKYPEAFTARVRTIAASHHLDRGINPCRLSEEEMKASLPEKILMAVDKYQAAISRRRLNHQGAISSLRSILFPKYESDPLMKSVIEAIEKLGRQDKMFPETASLYLSYRDQNQNLKAA